MIQIKNWSRSRFVLIVLVLLLLVITITERLKNLQNTTISIPSKTTSNIHGNLVNTESRYLDLVVATYKDDVSWVTSELGPDKKPDWRILILTRDDPSNPNNVAPNRAYEALPYIRYIAKYYDDLPPRIIFTQGHRNSWHVIGLDQTRVLRNLNVTLPWANLNFFHYLRTFQDPDEAIAAGTDSYVAGWDQDRWKDIEWVWSRVIESWAGTMPKKLAFHCCMGLMLSREHIRRLPKEFWVNLDDWVAKGLYGSPDFGCCGIENVEKRAAWVFEYLFHYLLTGETVEHQVRDPCAEGYLKCGPSPLYDGPREVECAPKRPCN